MTARTAYRDRADECLEKAHASEGREKEQWLRWALYWLEMADFADSQTLPPVSVPAVGLANPAFMDWHKDLPGGVVFMRASVEVLGISHDVIVSRRAPGAWLAQGNLAGRVSATDGTSAAAAVARWRKLAEEYVVEC